MILIVLKKRWIHYIFYSICFFDCNPTVVSCPARRFIVDALRLTIIVKNSPLSPINASACFVERTNREKNRHDAVRVTIYNDHVAVYSQCDP